MTAILVFILLLLLQQSILSLQQDISSCSPTSVLLKTIDNVTDGAWDMYIKAVYGPTARVEEFDNIDHFQSTYIMADVNVVTEWNQNPIKEIYMQHFLRKKRGPGLLDWSHGYPSNSWVEVSRSRECTHIYFSFEEGLSTGAKYSKTDFSYNDTIPYGCWFFVTRGTGVFVNVGKTLISYDREDVNRRFGLFCNRPPFCEPQGDRYWCQKALSEGYDSIQVVNANANENHELVICSGKCSTQPVDVNCAPMEIRTGYNASEPCNCVEGTPIINCNNSITTDICDFTVLRERHGKNHDEYWDCNMNKHKYKRKTCALITNKNNNNTSFEIRLIFSNNLREHYYPKISSLFKQSKSESPNTIMIEMGDLSFHTHLIHKVGPKKLVDLMKLSGFSVCFIGTNSHELEKVIDDKITIISNIPGILTSTTINTTDSYNLDGVIVGIIAYDHIDKHETLPSTYNDTYINTLIDHIKDEALCLKKTANVIVFLSHGGVAVDRKIREKTFGYVDIIVGLTPNNVTSCQNNWHTEHIPIIQGSFFKNMTGVVHIFKVPNGLNVKSNMISLDNIDNDQIIIDWIKNNR